MHFKGVIRSPVSVAEIKLVFVFKLSEDIGEAGTAGADTDSFLAAGNSFKVPNTAVNIKVKAEFCDIIGSLSGHEVAGEGSEVAACHLILASGNLLNIRAERLAGGISDIKAAHAALQSVITFSIFRQSAGAGSDLSGAGN